MGKHTFLRCIVLLVICATIAGLPLVTGARPVQELRAELESKRKSLQETERRIQEFRSEVQGKRQEARTLEDQIRLIEDNVKELTQAAERTKAEIEKINLEIEIVEQEIAEKEKEIAHQKKVLAEYLRSIHMLDFQSTITMLLKYHTFSEAMQESATIQELQNRAQQALRSIISLHEELLTKRRELEDFKQSLVALKERQEQEQRTLAVQQESKQRILDLTNAQEAQYQQLLRGAQQAHQAAQAAIGALDAQIREELRKQGVGSLPSVGIFDWPIQPIFGVSCEFRCGGYPYAHLIGAHSGMDIPAYVGTPIRAPADGYVARAHDSGNTNYSYIMLLHGDNITSIYGHVSGFAISSGQMVTRGTVIGYTGGAPGTRGAGLSTGPHLHFEVRVNNVPVNPRNYLR